MILILVLIVSTVFLAYSNGANDNFKGLATLYGSKTTNYKNAIWWATVTTFLGSLTSLYFGQKLLENFSGKGLVPDALASSPEFLIAVALSAGITVLFATIFGFPVSTTHALVGALAGTGFTALGRAVNFSKLGVVFLIPLLFSPIAAIVLSGSLYKILHLIRIKAGVKKTQCLCVTCEPEFELLDRNLNSAAVATSSLNIVVDDAEVCLAKYNTALVGGITIQKLLDFAHFLSSGLVSFARGLNDTPKIFALLLIVNALNIKLGILAVSVAIAFGGLLNAKKVAETMSNKITFMNSGQGFSANIVTAFLVIVASKLGMPVSTTHVSTGSIFGIGTINKKGNAKVMSSIVFSWLLTLPISALIGAILFSIIK